MDSQRLPITILTGFLGSGKTTLLNRLLRQPAMRGALVIVNEYGEVGLDHLLVETPQDETILLSNGCLCCAVLGDLVLTLTRLVQRRAAGDLPPFERVVIETTGLADPAPLLQTVLADETIASAFRLDAIVTVVDAANGAAQLDAHAESVKQAAVADRLVLSKTDVASDARLQVLRRKLRRLNRGAPILTAVRGEIAAQALLGDGAARNWSDWLGAEASAADEDAERARAAPEAARRRGHAHGRGGAGDGVDTFSLRRPGAVSVDGLRLWLNALARFKGPNLLRVKGIFNVEGEPVAVHAVQHLFHEPERLRAWPTEDRDTRIVFITQHLAQAEVEATLAALDFSASGADGPPDVFNSRDYARFVEAVRAFDPMARL